MLCHRYLGLRPMDCDDLDLAYFQDLVTILELFAQKERG